MANTYAHTVMVARMQRELEILEKDPPPGISCWPKGDSITELEAVIQGPEQTPYAKGLFKLNISIPQDYPNSPPKVVFITKIYHPNIDSAGRICLDLLVLGGKKGQWKPSINLRTLLLSIQLLLSHPNPEDGLVAEISAEYKNNYTQFEETAKEWTRRYASSLETTTTTTMKVMTFQSAEVSPSTSTRQQLSHFDNTQNVQKQSVHPPQQQQQQQQEDVKVPEEIPSQSPNENHHNQSEVEQHEKTDNSNINCDNNNDEEEDDDQFIFVDQHRSCIESKCSTQDNHTLTGDIKRKIDDINSNSTTSNEQNISKKLKLSK